MGINNISEVFDHLIEKPLSNNVQFIEFRDVGNRISNKFYISEEGGIYIKGTREINDEKETIFLQVDLPINSFLSMIIEADSINFNEEE